MKIVAILLSLILVGCASTQKPMPNFEKISLSKNTISPSSAIKVDAPAEQAAPKTVSNKEQVWIKSVGPTLFSSGQTSVSAVSSGGVSQEQQSSVFNLIKRSKTDVGKIALSSFVNEVKANQGLRSRFTSKQYDAAIHLEVVEWGLSASTISSENVALFAKVAFNFKDSSGNLLWNVQCIGDESNGGANRPYSKYQSGNVVKADLTKVVGIATQKCTQIVINEFEG